MSAKITFHGPYEFTPHRLTGRAELQLTDGQGNTLWLYLEGREQAEALSRAALIILDWLNSEGGGAS